MKAINAQENVLPVGELIVSNEQATPQTAVNKLAERFFSTTDLDAIAVVEGKEPIGLVTRTKLLFTLFRRFGFELYGKYPIIAIADTTALIVPENERLDVVIDKALERQPQDIYDEIIVTTPSGAYKGLLSVKQLVIQQSNSLATNILQKEMASARAKELEKINQVKSQFLANVTHELRSPVNAIIGLAELLRMSAEKGSIEQIKERLSFMISSATNLRAIITNILDLSKLEAGKMEVSFQEINATALISEIAETTRILVGKKPVMVKVEAPPLAIMISTDPIKLRQIIMNLAGNAAKFTEQGEITLSLSIIGSSRLEIAVADTGIGIKEQDIDKLFIAFGQVEDAKTKQHEGTGLGLTISKNLAELINGSISIRSAYGQGTTFVVSLPLQNNNARQGEL
ncbi:MAG: HAMP domain-containing sensor histidine kinase [Nitrospiraceae bacterium]|nr:HAMP domain-containing sensor histidine kinase [Nitrospiraceae bacterium]